MDSFEETIRKAKELLDKYPDIPTKLIIMFSDMVEEDTCFEGSRVNEMMGCGEREKGILMSSSLRGEVEKLGSFVEVIDKPKPNYAPFGSIPVEIRELSWKERLKYG